MKSFWKKATSLSLAALLFMQALPVNVSLAAPIHDNDVPGKSLWITEIYPNDVNRKRVYGNDDDHMEFIEITNTTEADIRFDEGYELWYDYNSGQKSLQVTPVGQTSGQVIIKSGQSAVLWNRRDDLGGVEGENYASEEQFRAAMMIPAEVDVYEISGQNGFAANDRGFAIKKGEEVLSSFHYSPTTDLNTKDGLSVHLKVPDYGTFMDVYANKKLTSAGFVLSDQLSGQMDREILYGQAAEGVFITEMRPRDISRQGTYMTGGDQVMEGIEIYNATDQVVDLNEEYILEYIVKENDTVALPLYKLNEDGRTIGTDQGITIAPRSAAVIWPYRSPEARKGLAADKFIKVPTEADYRQELSIPDDVPVYISQDRNGLNNSDSGFDLYKKNEDGSKTLVSRYFYDGNDDMSGGTSVDLRPSSEGPIMEIFEAKAKSTLGIVKDGQKTYRNAPGKAPVISQIEEITSVTQGDFLRIPYAYESDPEDPTVAISVYYRSNKMKGFVANRSTSFSIYNKWYAYIPSTVFVDADYVDYYVKAETSTNQTVLPIQRITVEKVNQPGLNVHMTETEDIKGSFYFSANDTSGSAEIKAALDGQALDLSDALSPGAFLTFSHTGIDSYFKNALTIGDQVIRQFPKSLYVPSNSSMTILVDQSYFTYNEDGTANVKMTIRTGTYGSPWESHTDANNDDFVVTDLALQLPSGRVIRPDKIVGNRTDDEQIELKYNDSIKVGDTSGQYLWIDLYFSVAAAEINGKAASIDTTQLSDGPHTLTVHSGSETKTIDFTVKNTEDVEPEPEPPTPTNLNLTVKEVGRKAEVVADELEGASEVELFKAQEISNMVYYTGTGDSTSDAKFSRRLQNIKSDNGEFPYAIFELQGQGNNDLRIDLDASVDYNRPIQLYVLNTEENAWELLETTRDGDQLTAIFSPENRLDARGKVKVMAQARTTEALPKTSAPNTSATVKNDYDWDGTGVPDQYDFSIAWITDTQYYSERYHENFDIMTDWIVDNKDTLDIQYVFHTGDIVDEFDEDYQYQIAQEQLYKFRDAGIPYGVLPGNHDNAMGTPIYDFYYRYFGADEFKDQLCYGKENYKNNMGHYDLITVDGEELLFLSMGWDIYTEELEWMNKILAQFPDRKAFILTHPGIKADGSADYFADLITENVVKQNPNVVAMMNGHYHGAAINNVDIDGRTVYRILTDYQSAPGGGETYVKMLYFDLANNKIYVNSYSPKLEDFNYYDTPKLDDYTDPNLILRDIDILDLPVNFDRAPKTLAINEVKASILTEEKIASGKPSEKIAVESRSSFEVYAQYKNESDEIIGYSKPAQIKGIIGQTMPFLPKETTDQIQSIFQLFRRPWWRRAS